MRDGYVQWLTIPTRWGDNDVYGHVNNVVYYAFMDTAINTYLIAEGGLDIHGGSTIGLCVQSSCEFRAPLAFPDPVEAGLRAAHLGRSSVRYEIALFSPGADTPAAEGTFTHVFVDRATRRPTEIASPLRPALEKLLRP
ncbi:thioesterase family protein [Crossiella sp. CA-258035]|uniref:acyl-CoA thioesterase n=1 Tax=Crossiella sp. CA-258035 TaxID=2981138 RepID=UPI0024BCA46F|nr:thioesterase family protein [Crossiella sp. CA-258035]WHT16618.1 thioesterase family protein [Crossiella sp. CA-258035]